MNFSTSNHKQLYALRSGKQQIQSKAIEKMLAECEKTVINYIIRNKGTRAEAKDVLAEAVIVFWKKAQNPAFTLEVDYRGYFFGIARTLWKKKLNQKQRVIINKASTKNIHRSLSSEDPHYEYEKTELYELIENAIHTMSDRSKIILDVEFGNLPLSDQELCLLLTIKPSNLRQLKSRSLRKLKKLIKSY